MKDKSCCKNVSASLYFEGQLRRVSTMDKLKSRDVI